MFTKYDYYFISAKNFGSLADRGASNSPVKLVVFVQAERWIELHKNCSSQPVSYKILIREDQKKFGQSKQCNSKMVFTLGTLSKPVQSVQLQRVPPACVDKINKLLEFDGLFSIYLDLMGRYIRHRSYYENYFVYL